MATRQKELGTAFRLWWRDTWFDFSSPELQDNEFQSIGWIALQKSSSSSSADHGTDEHARGPRFYWAPNPSSCCDPTFSLQPNDRGGAMRPLMFSKLSDFIIRREHAVKNRTKTAHLPHSQIDLDRHHRHPSNPQISCFEYRFQWHLQLVTARGREGDCEIVVDTADACDSNTPPPRRDQTYPIASIACLQRLCHAMMSRVLFHWTLRDVALFAGGHFGVDDDDEKAEAEEDPTAAPGLHSGKHPLTLASAGQKPFFASSNLLWNQKLRRACLETGLTLSSSASEWVRLIILQYYTSFSRHALYPHIFKHWDCLSFLDEYAVSEAEGIKCFSCDQIQCSDLLFCMHDGKMPAPATTTRTIDGIQPQPSAPPPPPPSPSPMINTDFLKHIIRRQLECDIPWSHSKMLSHLVCDRGHLSCAQCLVVHWDSMVMVVFSPTEPQPHLNVRNVTCVDPATWRPTCPFCNFCFTTEQCRAIWQFYALNTVKQRLQQITDKLCSLKAVQMLSTWSAPIWPLESSAHLCQTLSETVMLVNRCYWWIQFWIPLVLKFESWLERISCTPHLVIQPVEYGVDDDDDGASSSDSVLLVHPLPSLIIQSPPSPSSTVDAADVQWTSTEILKCFGPVLERFSEDFPIITLDWIGMLNEIVVQRDILKERDGRTAELFRECSGLTRCNAPTSNEADVYYEMAYHVVCVRQYQLLKTRQWEAEGGTRTMTRDEASETLIVASEDEHGDHYHQHHCNHQSFQKPLLFGIGDLLARCFQNEDELGAQIPSFLQVRLRDLLKATPERNGHSRAIRWVHATSGKRLCPFCAIRTTGHTGEVRNSSWSSCDIQTCDTCKMDWCAACQSIVWESRRDDQNEEETICARLQSSSLSPLILWMQEEQRLELSLFSDIQAAEYVQNLIRELIQALAEQRGVFVNLVLQVSGDDGYLSKVETNALRRP
jgi:hypothetical protein